MSSLGSVCRFCLKNASNNESLPLDASLKEKLEHITPELKLTLSTDSIVCSTCKNLLEESHKLKRSCSSGNKLIRFLRNHSGITYPIELRELLKGNAKKQDEKCCRICLKSNESVYITIKEAKSKEFGSVLASCLSTLDENLTLNPLICKICTNAFQNMCTFIKQLTDVEKKVKSYKGKFPSVSVDLLKVKNSEGQASEIKGQVEVTNDLTSEEEIKNHPFSAEFDDDCYKEETPIIIDLDDVDDHESEISVTGQNMDFSIDTDGLPRFEFNLGMLLAPHKRKFCVADWVERVEEIRAKNNWSEIITKHKILGRMKKLPALHSWFSSVADIIGWEDWKDRLIHAFPGEDDFYTKNLRMMDRRKRTNETCVAYYNDKLPLLKDMNLSNEEMVSCLLGGLGDIMVLSVGRMGKHKTPEELLEHFKMCDDRVEANKQKKKNVMKKTEDTECNKTCSKCKASGHLATNCPFAQTKKLVVLLEHTKIDISDSKCEVPQSNIENQENSGLKCSCCDQKGHLSLDCPLIKPNKISLVTPTENAESGTKKSDIIVTENTLREVSKESKNDESITDKNEPNSSTPDKETVAASSKGLKCVCCDKVGHSSVDCPLIRGKPKVQQTQSYDKPSDRLKNIDDLVIVIHDDDDDTSSKPSDLPGSTNDVSQKNTPSSRTNIRITFDKNKVKPLVSNVSEHTGKDDLVCEDNLHKERLSQKKCLCCNKEGHTSLNCPFIKPQDTNNSRQNIEKSTVDQTKNKVAQSKSTTSQCLGCNKSGHSTFDCPLIKMSNKEKENTEKLAEEKNQSEPHQSKATVKEPRKCLGCNKLDHSTVNCPLINGSSNSKQNQEKDAKDQKRNKDQMPQTSQKCLSCDKSDHSTANCPLIKGSGNSKQNQEKDAKDQKQNKDQMPQSSQKCFSCNKSGHLAANCPFIKGNINSKQNQEKDVKGQMPQSSQKCFSCNKFGHLAANCPLIKGSSSSSKQSQEKDAKDQMPQSSQKCFSCNKFGHLAANCPLIKGSSSSKQNQEKDAKDQMSQSSQKCFSCNKFGHLAANCPLIKGSSSSKQSQEKDAKDQMPQSSQKCFSCNKFGHLAANCPHIKGSSSSKQSQEKDAKDQMPQSSQKCFSCNKFGHLAANCPLIKGSSSSKQNQEKDAKDQMPQSSQKCFSCNKFGHLAANCPLIKGSSNNKQNQEKDAKDQMPQSSQKCFSCNKIGHLAANCPLIKGSSNNKQNQEKDAKDQMPQSSQKCFSCNKSGHLAANCPLIKGSSSSKQNQEKDAKDQKQNKDQMPQSSRKCFSCNKSGHLAANCPLIKGNSNSKQNQEKNAKDQKQNKDQMSQSSKKCFSCNKFGHLAANCPLIKGNSNSKQNKEKDVKDQTQNKDQMPQTSRKCLGCNKSDHSTVNCPLINGSSSEEQNQRKGEENQKQNKAQKPETSLKCLTCNKSDHLTINCYLSGVNKSKSAQVTQKAADQNNGNKIEDKTAFKTCLGCNNIGHTVLNCPFIGIKGNITRQATEKTIEYQKNENKMTPETSQASERCLACNQFGHSIFSCLLINVSKISNEKRKAEAMSGKSETATSSSTIRRCLSCNNVGHSSMDCPLKERHDTKIEKQGMEKIDQPKHDAQAIEQSDEAKCSFCNKPGHTLDFCPFYSFFLKTNTGTSGNTSTSISEAKETLKRTLESTPIDDRYNPYNPEALRDHPPQKRSRIELQEKCAICNEFGHNSVDCLQSRRRGLQSSWPPSRDGYPSLPPRRESPSLFTRKREYPKVLTCDLCKKVGHRVLDCPSARFGSFSMGGGLSRQCLGCGKFGHLQVECPKSKPPQRRRF